MNIKLSALLVSTSLLLFCTISPPAFSDGMPFREKAPEPILTPLDHTLNNTKAPQPLDVTTAMPEAPAAPATTPPALQPEKTADTPEATPPVPESRIVEVQPNTSFFGLSVGMYDPVTHNEKAAAFNLEWQPGVKIAGFLQPIFGAIVTTNGAMLGYGGLGVPFKVTDHVMLMPSIAMGAYRKGGGYDLGRTLAYRIGTELAYEFQDKSRIGLNLHILTNGRSTGREDRTEVFGLTYTTPFNMMPAAHELNN